MAESRESMAEIGIPEKRRILIPQTVPEEPYTAPKEPVKAPEKVPA